MDPKPYLEFLALQRRATVVITDSGGIQEETNLSECALFDRAREYGAARND
jgi:UDP-N-acetylglucosamine 2-epimerase